MAQTGYTPLQLYRSSTPSATPSAGNLADGELAINTADGKLFYKDSGGVVQTLIDKNTVGNVVGPASSTDSNLAAFDGTTGKLIKQAATVTVAQGGTGATTLTGILKGNGTSAFSAAIAGTDYLAPPAGTSILKANSGGALANAAAGTDYVAPGGALGTPSSGTLSNCTIDGTNSAGYLNIPQNSKSAAYTLVLSDSGKHILHPSADTTARTFTIPANSSVAFPIGTAITFVNQSGAGTVTIAITTDTMRLAGPGTTGSRTLTANGVATAIKITSTEWIISGTNLT